MLQKHLDLVMLFLQKISEKIKEIKKDEKREKYQIDSSFQFIYGKYIEFLKEFLKNLPENLKKQYKKNLEEGGNKISEDEQKKVNEKLVDEFRNFLDSNPDFVDKVYNTLENLILQREERKDEKFIEKLKSSFDEQDSLDDEGKKRKIIKTLCDFPLEDVPDKYFSLVKYIKDTIKIYNRFSKRNIENIDIKNILFNTNNPLKEAELRQYQRSLEELLKRIINNSEKR